MATEIGTFLKQQRLNIPLTIDTLARAAGISVSHLSRIETGSRFPSAKVLRKIAKPLGFEVGELFVLAGFLSAEPTIQDENAESLAGKIDPKVAILLAREPVEVQRIAVQILLMLKNAAEIKDNQK